MLLSVLPLLMACTVFGSSQEDMAERMLSSHDMSMSAKGKGKGGKDSSSDSMSGKGKGGKGSSDDYMSMSMDMSMPGGKGSKSSKSSKASKKSSKKSSKKGGGGGTDAPAGKSLLRCYCFRQRKSKCLSILISSYDFRFSPKRPYGTGHALSHFCQFHPYSGDSICSLLRG
jgi:hypothetical protein